LYEELLPKKYKRFLLRSYVEDNSKVKWCPAPGCDYAVEYPKHKARFEAGGYYDCNKFTKNRKLDYIKKSLTAQRSEI
jgi:hypothetical protein